ncbi:U11/U12 small nuclear ribonucleoprotein 25 kDa protein-like [Mercurialis annua]|uniref:U11/U12 small nuclear ribonucleoprotein 25 kDa protein-like n=1 Tax=Mercurialis annua TaxID=3986 RepID=UPI0024AF30CB|nr:U11/U12 small nuclear ribonucleoprotein 25 kDa protein-like [Mercurialis annua]
MSMTCPSLTCVSFAYERLPLEHFRLSIIKLNGSFFEVEVSMMATVGELKQAVENVFNSSPDDDMHINISWWHVWSQFCLCYKGLKLVNDKAYIQSYGIDDGDQLYFARHLATNDSTSSAMHMTGNLEFQSER